MKSFHGPFFVLCLFVLTVARGVAPGVVRRGVDGAFSQHVKRVLKFPCSKPQPRAVTSIDLLENKEKLSPYEYVLPPMTVLHRCDPGSGCCMQGAHMTCGLQLESEVSLEFKLIDWTSGGERRVVISASNHTQCSCRHVNDFPK